MMAALAELVLAKGQHCHEAAEHATTFARRSLAGKQRCHEAAEHGAALADTALAEEQCRNEVGEHTAMLAARALADKQHHHEVAKCAMALAAKASADNKKAVKRNTALAANGSVNNKEAAVCARESTGATLAAQRLVEDKRRQVDDDAAQCLAVADHAAVLVEPPSGDAAIERIGTDLAPCTDPLDAILAEIAWEETAHTALEPLMTPSAHPMAMSLLPPRPTSYVCTILASMGGEPCSVIASVICSTIAYC